MTVSPGNTATVIFSKDRPAQLDLLLRSIHLNAPRLANPLHVLYDSTDESFAKGYRVVQREHRNVSYWMQRDFQDTFESILNYLQSSTIMCMTDDSVFYRKFSENPSAVPARLLDATPGILCVSLRLGENTTSCYPMASESQRAQFTVRGPLRIWNKRAANGDFGYAGSLDAHVFRADQFRALIANSTYGNPNELEDALSMAAHVSTLDLMCSYQKSLYVSIPANRVNVTHDNRFMASALMRPDLLNHEFLQGRRLDLGSVRSDRVDAAHSEFNLRWEEVLV